MIKVRLLFQIMCLVLLANIGFAGALKASEQTESEEEQKKQEELKERHHKRSSSCFACHKDTESIAFKKIMKEIDILSEEYLSNLKNKSFDELSKLEDYHEEKK